MNNRPLSVRRVAPVEAVVPTEAAIDAGVVPAGRAASELAAGVPAKPRIRGTGGTEFDAGVSGGFIGRLANEYRANLNRP